MGETVKIGKSADVQRLIDDLSSVSHEIEEAMVLYTVRGSDGAMEIDWLNTGGSSRIWTMGALEYLKQKIYESED